MKSIYPHLYIGTFDAEKYWRNEDYARLPAIKNSYSELIVSSLDELQFVFCSNINDILFTRYIIDEVQLNYLRGLGFQFTNKYYYNDEDTVDQSVDNLCFLLTQASGKSYLPSIEKLCFCPYSIDKFSKPFCEKYNIIAEIPESNIVQEVNSKFFSFGILKNLSPLYKGELVDSCDLLLKHGKKILRKSGPFLIKDGFGVSGKGNILIESESVLQNIHRHLFKQEKKGKVVQFILEPFLRKKIDFSCQLEISPDGSIEYKSIQIMQNKAFAFLGIKEADQSFCIFLEKNGYYDIVRQIADKVYKRGYFGILCIDSMLLIDDSIFPLLEINARKSMGTINTQFKQYFENRVNTFLMSYSISIPSHVNYELFMDKLDSEGILFTLTRGFGVIPLSSCAFSVNHKRVIDSRYQGRIYVEYVYENDKIKDWLEMKLKEVFLNLNIKNY